MMIAMRVRVASSRFVNSRGRDLLRGSALLLCAGVVCLCAATSEYVWAKGELGAKDARNLIRRMAGSELPSGAVRILTITPSASSEAVALAQIETAFRFESNDDESWRVAEIRTAGDRWEDLSLIARAAGGGQQAAAASTEEGAMRGEVSRMASQPFAGALDGGRAREMIARLAGITLPSDAVRVKEISSLYKSAVVVARITAEFRFAKGNDNRWRLTEFRTGDGEWKDIETILHAVNTEKARRARSELEALAAALDRFRRERGFYVIADTTVALVDQLNPRYLPRVVRLDPWHKPYLYEGERDRYVLRSAGADGEPGTADDINVAGHAQGFTSTGN
jgi:hypothetical protein